MKYTKHIFTTTFIVIVTLTILAGCKNNNNKERETEKYSEKTKLFLGYELGMTKQEFYDRSWELNDKGLVRQGPNNQSVYYELDDELNHPCDMYFYPSFHNEKVYQMGVRFEYANWAPWNKELHSDKLQEDVIDLFKEWYGDGFEKKSEKRKGKKTTIYVKKDKNRRIAVTKKGSKAVVAIITDIVAAEAKNNNS